MQVKIAVIMGICTIMFLKVINPTVWATLAKYHSAIRFQIVMIFVESILKYYGDL